MPEAVKLTGTDRAAILLMSLGEKEAAEVLRHMGPKDVQKIGTAMAGMSSVTRDQVQGVLQTFYDVVSTQTNLGVGNDEYIRKVLTDALGADKAGGLIDRILLGQNRKGLEAMKWMEPRAVAEMIRLEHPQIISIVLAYLEPDQAGEVLSFLPERLRPDVLMRIASLDGIQPSALQELDEILEKNLAGSSNVRSSGAGGVKAAANILNFMEASKSGQVLEQIKEADADLSQSIQDKMFVFDNLGDVDDRSIQHLLREVSSDVLVIALKGADPRVQDKIFKNMSKRAAEMLRDDLEVKGPVRLSEVEAAQKEILATARRMAEAGEIALGGGGEDYV